MKRSILTWFGHTEMMENEEFVKKVHLSSVEGPYRRGRPLGKWGNGLEWAKIECMDRERWRSVCHHMVVCHSPWGRFRRERDVRAID